MTVFMWHDTGVPYTAGSTRSGMHSTVQSCAAHRPNQFFVPVWVQSSDVDGCDTCLVDLLRAKRTK